MSVFTFELAAGNLHSWLILIRVSPSLVHLGYVMHFKGNELFAIGILNTP